MIRRRTSDRHQRRIDRHDPLIGRRRSIPTTLFSSSLASFISSHYCRRDGRSTAIRMSVCLLAYLDKKLSDRRGNARRAVLVNSCYVSRGMGGRKVSNIKSDLQGHSLATVPFDRPHTISYYCEGFKTSMFAGFWKFIAGVPCRKEDSWRAGVGCSTGSDCVATGSGVSMTSAMPQALRGLVGCWARSGICSLSQVFQLD